MLLEVTLALAVFILAAGAILVLMSEAQRTLQDARRQELLADLARSALAQIECGLARPETLAGPVAAWPASMADGEAREPATELPGVGHYELRINTRPTETTGVIIVEVRAIRLEPAPAGQDPVESASFTLRQAVRLPGVGGGA
ncbi:MAG: hypothetical protein ACT4PL_02430 [Phycisphaerales bacterium]